MREGERERERGWGWGRDRVREGERVREREWGWGRERERERERERDEHGRLLMTTCMPICYVIIRMSVCFFVCLSVLSVCSERHQSPSGCRQDTHGL